MKKQLATRKTEAVICLNCRSSFIPKRDNSRFCCTRCHKAYYQRGYNTAKRGSACEYNEAVICVDKKCSACGWNPDVAAARKAEVEKKHEI